jgi:hypothetical protein
VYTSAFEDCLSAFSAVKCTVRRAKDRAAPLAHVTVLCVIDSTCDFDQRETSRLVHRFSGSSRVACHLRIGSAPFDTVDCTQATMDDDLAALFAQLEDAQETKAVVCAQSGASALLCYRVLSCSCIHVAVSRRPRSDPYSHCMPRSIYMCTCSSCACFRCVSATRTELTDRV